jgi:hypothetical protein
MVENKNLNLFKAIQWFRGLRYNKSLFTVILLSLLVTTGFIGLLHLPLVRAEESFFGYPVVGGSSSSYTTHDIIMIDKYTTPNDMGNITNISMYGFPTGGDMKFVVYSDSEGTPLSLIYESEELTGVPSSWQWQNISCNFELSQNTAYWFGYFAKGGHWIKYDDAGSVPTRYSIIPEYPSTPSTFESSGSNTKPHSIYMNYTVAESEPTPTPTTEPTPTPEPSETLSFGYTTIGGTLSTYDLADIIMVSKYTTPSDMGNLTSISMYGYPIDGEMKPVVYADSAGTPTTKIYEGDAVTGIAAEMQWQTMPCSVVLSPSTDYWFGFFADGGQYSRYDVGAVSTKYCLETYPNAPSTFFSNGSNTIARSIFMNYTAAAGASTGEKIMCLGDSITQGSLVDTPYPTTLSTLTGKTVDNYGYSSYNTTQVLNSWNTHKSGDYSKVVVLVGIANIRHDLDMDVSKNEVFALWMDAKVNYGISVYALTVLPFRGDGNWSPERQIVLEDFNDWIRTNATANGINVVDTWLVFRNITEPERMITAYDIGDHLHPNQVGTDAIANAVYSVFLEANPSPSPSVSPALGGGGLPLVSPSPSSWFAPLPVVKDNPLLFFFVVGVVFLLLFAFVGVVFSGGGKGVVKVKWIRR